jgi:hypothetical protein
MLLYERFVQTTDLSGLFTLQQPRLECFMLADGPSHILCLVARGVIDEEYDALRTMPLRALKDVREMELELPAPPLLELVPDEHMLLGPEERHEDVLPLVVAGGGYPLLMSLPHPLGFYSMVEPCPCLVLECDHNPFFANADAACL